MREVAVDSPKRGKALHSEGWRALNSKFSVKFRCRLFSKKIFRLPLQENVPLNENVTL